MDLKTFLTVLWRRKFVILATTIVALSVTTAGLFMITPTYVASTTIRVGTASSGSTDWVSYDIQYTDRLMNTYRTMVLSGQMAGQVMERTGMTTRPKIQVSIPANTELMTILVEDVSPEQAQRAANAVAEILITQVDAQVASSTKSTLDILAAQLTQIQEELTQARLDYDRLVGSSPDDQRRLAAARESIALKESTYSSLLSQYDRLRSADSQRSNRMTVVQEADLPTTPANPQKTMILPLGLFIGLIGGLGLAFLLENLDTRLHSTDQIERATELPVLGKTPAGRHDRHFGLFAHRTPQEEAFRRLRTNLLALEPNDPPRSLVVTSSEPNEGKSTTIANLALAVAQSGRQVVVVDADLRKPVLHRIFEVPNSIGLVNVITRDAPLDEALQYTMIPGIQILTSGPASPNPAELLGLPQMGDLVDTLAEQFDLVLIDTPSLQTVTDAAVLSRMVDGVLLVVARGQTRRESVRSALQELANVRTEPLGVVVNRCEMGSHFHYGRPPADGDSSTPLPPFVVSQPAEPSAAGAVRSVPAIGGSEPTILRRLHSVTQTGTGNEPSPASDRPSNGHRLERTLDEPVAMRRLYEVPRPVVSIERGEQECFESRARLAGK